MGVIVTFAASQIAAALNTVNTYRANSLELYTQHPQPSMKFNLKTVALTSFAAIALLSAPLGLVNAAQAEGGRSGHRSGHRLEQLDLTDAQSTQIEAIHTDARDQMQSVLTNEQRATLEGSEGRRAWRALDLSDSQREQLRSIREASKEEISAVLTEEQRSQIQSMREERRGRRGGNRR